MTLKLPKATYGTICNKILTEFMQHHKIEGLILPSSGDTTPGALEKIFTIILASLPEDKRNAILKDCEAYYHDTPPSVR